MKKIVVISILALVTLVAAGAFALAQGAPGGSAAPGRHTVEAPIDGLDIIVRESYPPQVALRITAGLPNGCAQVHSHSVTRAGDTFTVKVLNSMPDGSPMCTMIYGTYELQIELGSVETGRTYTIVVNDQTKTLTLD